MRDVRPQFSYADIPKLEAGLKLYIKTSLAPVVFVLGVMEIESWFLAESSHFSRIDPSLTADLILARLGFHPVNDDMQLRASPAEDLNNCYALVGKSYTKGAGQTVPALDFGVMYLELPAKIAYLATLIEVVEDFLSV